MKLIDYLEKAYFPPQRKKEIKKEVGQKEYDRFNFRREAAFIFVCRLEEYLRRIQS